MHCAVGIEHDDGVGVGKLVTAACRAEEVIGFGDSLTLRVRTNPSPLESIAVAHG
jgi:hypothetical protein